MRPRRATTIGPCKCRWVATRKIEYTMNGFGEGVVQRVHWQRAKSMVSAPLKSDVDHSCELWVVDGVQNA